MHLQLSLAVTNSATMDGITAFLDGVAGNSTVEELRVSTAEALPSNAPLASIEHSGSASQALQSTFSSAERAHAASSALPARTRALKIRWGASGTIP